MLLKDFDYKPTATAEHVAIAKAFLDKDPKDFSGVGNWRSVQANGKHTDWVGRGCHASLCTETSFGVAVAFAHPHRTGVEKPEDTSLFTKWLWEESFASRFVLDIGKDGAVVSGDIPSCLMQNIAILSRHPRELGYLKYHQYFSELYPLVGGDLAYVLSFNTSYSEDRWSTLFKNQGAAHRAWHLFDIDALGNFLRGDFGIQLDQTKDKLFSKRHPGLWGGTKYCYSNGRVDWTNFAEELYSSDSKFLEYVLEERRRRDPSVIYHPPNPFVVSRNPVKQDHEFTHREVVEIVLPYMKEKGLIP